MREPYFFSLRPPSPNLANLAAQVKCHFYAFFFSSCHNHGQLKNGWRATKWPPGRRCDIPSRNDDAIILKSATWGACRGRGPRASIPTHNMGTTSICRTAFRCTQTGGFHLTCAPTKAFPLRIIGFFFLLFAASEAPARPYLQCL